MIISKVLSDIKNGDEQAFKSLFHNYYKNLVIFAYGILNDKDWAEDTVQEFFVNFWCKRKNIVVENSIEGYLYCSVKYACFNQLRRNKSIRVPLQDIELYSSNLHSEENYFQDEKNELYKAINLLPNQRKKIFILCNFEDLKYNEVAKLLNISVNTVRTQMGRAYKSIRYYLKDRIFPHDCHTKTF